MDAGNYSKKYPLSTLHEEKGANTLSKSSPCEARGQDLEVGMLSS